MDFGLWVTDAISPWTAHGIPDPHGTVDILGDGELLALNFIEKADTSDPRYGNYGSNTTVARKKDAQTGEWTDTRVCQDSRKANAKCKADQYVGDRCDLPMDGSWDPRSPWNC